MYISLNFRFNFTGKKEKAGGRGKRKKAYLKEIVEITE